MEPATSRRIEDGDETTVDARRHRLLAWYDDHARDLPWRCRTDLYGTWISEVMLQQTTVAAVIPRWSAFLQRFPDVHALAAAGEHDVLTAWSGLGYYRRARMLHRAAREVVDRYGGRLPTTHADWRDLPGIGDYTAGAIASIGLGLPTAAVDANVKRVLTRWTCADDGAARDLTAKALQALATNHVPAERPGDWNQALMDLGAGHCRSGEPDCVGCPVLEVCAAGAAGTGRHVPPPPVRETSRPVLLSALVLRRDGRVLLVPSEESVVTRCRGLGRPSRDDVSGLYVGMLGLPTTPWYHAGAADTAKLTAPWRRWLAGRGSGACEVRDRGWVRHAITVYRLQVLVCVADWAGDPDAVTVPGSLWIAGSAADQPISTLARKILQQTSLE